MVEEAEEAVAAEAAEEAEAEAVVEAVERMVCVARRSVGELHRQTWLGLEG